jgi:hypothetical protein
MDIVIDYEVNIHCIGVPIEKDERHRAPPQLFYVPTVCLHRIDQHPIRSFFSCLPEAIKFLIRAVMCVPQEDAISSFATLVADSLHDRGVE